MLRKTTAALILGKLAENYVAAQNGSTGSANPEATTSCFDRTDLVLFYFLGMGAGMMLTTLISCCCDLKNCNITITRSRRNETQARRTRNDLNEFAQTQPELQTSEVARPTTSRHTESPSMAMEPVRLKR